MININTEPHYPSPEAFYNQLQNEIDPREIKYLDEYKNITRDILSNKVFIKLHNITHHKHTTRLMHSLRVSFKSFVFCKKNNLNYKSAAKGALLHDFFLVKRNELCGISKFLIEFRHPQMALGNSERYFELNDIEKDCIIHHMFPITLLPARHIEAWIIIFYDKYLAFYERFPERKPHKTPVAKRIEAKI